MFFTNGNGDEPKEISEMVGYENLSYFSSVFVRYVGCLPSLYRKNLQDNE
ncbi:helix-turn-helix domain-containing protein [Koleobacter methoxysyntrophicus]